MHKQHHLRHLQEHIQVLEREEVELINIPVPEFEDGDPANIVHDFHRVRRPSFAHPEFPIPRFTI